MDELPAKAILNENNGLKILEEPLAVDTYGIIVDKGNTELLEAINTVINKLKSEGKIDEYVLKHIKNS